MIPTADIFARFGWPVDRSRPATVPLAIAHRGASDHAPENTLKAFRLAAELGAEMWELDVRLSADGICMVSHDAVLARMGGVDLVVSEQTAECLQSVPLHDGERMPRLSNVIALARELGCGLYIELKDKESGPAVVAELDAAGFTYAAVGAFDPNWIAPLRAAGCTLALSVLVPAGRDPLDYVAPARPDIVHLCWLNADDRPDTLITDDLIGRIQASGAEIVTWHEDRPEIIAALRTKPILGICSNRPEVIKPARRPRSFSYVCHRGANTFAPENTLNAARICFDQGFDFVELDVRTTKDGHLVVMHDAMLERTTDGTGLVCDRTLAEIRRLDAGMWFSSMHAGLQVPTLREMLDYARPRGGLYIEIKHASPSQVLDEVTATDMMGQCFFWGADTDALVWMRTQSEDVQLMAPRWMYPSVAAAHADYRAQIIEFDVTRDDLDELALCREMGLRTMIYSQSHDWHDLAGYANLQPDMVNLDRPDRFKLLTDYGWLP